MMLGVSMKPIVIGESECDTLENGNILLASARQEVAMVTQQQHKGPQHREKGESVPTPRAYDPAISEGQHMP